MILAAKSFKQGFKLIVGVGEVLIDRELSKKAVMVVNEDNGKVELQRTGLKIVAHSARDKGGNESNINQFNPQVLSLVIKFF